MTQKNTLGARVKILKALALAILAWSTAPVQAATISFGYVGADRTPPTIIPGQGQLIRITDGVGSFSFQPPLLLGTLKPEVRPLTPQSGTFGLADLASFTLDTNTIFTFSQLNPSGFPSSGFFSYGLADLTSFSATFANGALTALSFETGALSAISTSGNGDFGLQSFRVTGLGPDGASTFNGDFQLLTSGQLEIAAVPEPATWALMIIGFGMIGGTLRARRRQIAFA
jgi:PEP-CTERM motif